MPSNHLHHFLHYFAINRELSELYASFSIRTFAIGLVAIFEPVYIYLYFGQSLPKTSLFLAAIFLGFALLVPFGAKLVTKIGIKHTILFSAPVLFLYYVALWKIEYSGWLVLAAIFLKIIYMAVFWPAFHMDFSRFSVRESRGKEFSQLAVMSSLAAAISPFIGGIILMSFGYPVLFVMVLVLLLVSVWPLFFSQEIHETYTDSFQKAFGEIFKKEYWKKTAVFMAEGIEGAVFIYIWPLFMFVLAISYSYMGVITSGALILGLIFVLYLGRLIDRTDRKKLVSLGAILNAITWPVRMFVQTPLDALLVNVLHRFTRASLTVPYASLFYDWVSGEEINRDRFIILREVSSGLARAVFFILLAMIFTFTSKLAVAFPIAAIASLVFMLF